MLSTIDGLNLFTGKMDEATHFGGRGFSIWKTSDMSLVFDSGDEIEKELANSMKAVFNTDCIRNTITYQGPENLRDTQSDDYVSIPAKQMVFVILGRFTSLRQLKSSVGYFFLLWSSLCTKIIFKIFT